MAVVNNIKEIREQRGIYQDELAEATGYCTKTIGRMRTWGKHPIRRVYAADFKIL